MKIGIDARVLDRKVTGTSRYLLNLLNEIPLHDKKNEYFMFCSTDIDVDINYFRVIKVRKSKIPFKIYSPVWLNYDLPKLIKLHKIDLLFSPNVIVPLVDLGNTKKISVVHDVIFKVYKEYYPFFYRQYLSLLLPLSLKRSDRIITVSELSKIDIVKYYSIDEHKIDVVYNTASKQFKPVDISNSTMSEELKQYDLPNKYLLYVGVVEKRKNILGLLKIHDSLEKKGSDLSLVIIGKAGYDSISILPELMKRKAKIKYINFVSDEALTYIYNMAFAFIFPSFYEGFGIPPLEAMQSGVPVLSSNTSALVEVVGDGGVMHDPNDYKSFVNDIIRLESDPNFYEEMKSKGLRQAQKFNITETTKKLVNIFNQF